MRRRIRSDSPTDSAVLFYDGTCGFCSAIVRFVLDREQSKTLRFATLQGPAGETLMARHPGLSGVDSVVLVVPGLEDEAERVFTRSDAALRLAGHLGGFWRLANLAFLIPRPVRNAVYDILARHRHRLTRRTSDCQLPDADTRGRFLG